MHVFLILVSILLSACSQQECPDKLTFEITPAGGTYHYCQWKFEFPAGTVSKPTQVTVKKSLTTQVKNTTLMALEHPQTHELESVELNLDTAPGYETIEFSILDPSAVKNAEAIAICPGAELLVTERFGESGSDSTATPVDQAHGKNPCFQLYHNSTQDSEPVYLSAAGTDWSDAWNRLLNTSSEIYSKYLSGYLVVDPCVVCSYGGFQLASYLVPSDCHTFTKDLICNATLPAIATALPLVLMPPLKQGICSAAKGAITSALSYASSFVSGPSFNTICDAVDYGNGKSSILIPAVKDLFGCSFQSSCNLITTCNSNSLQSKWIKSSIEKCSEIDS